MEDPEGSLVFSPLGNGDWHYCSNSERGQFAPGLIDPVPNLRDTSIAVDAATADAPKPAEQGRGYPDSKQDSNAERREPGSNPGCSAPSVTVSAEDARLIEMRKALQDIYDATEGYADGAPDASAHDRLCNDMASIAKAALALAGGPP